MSEPEEAPAHGIAVIGMAGRFPGADSAARFWENLAAGREALFGRTDEQDDFALVAAEGAETSAVEGDREARRLS